MRSIGENTIVGSDTIPPRGARITPSHALDWSRFLERKNLLLQAPYNGSGGSSVHMHGRPWLS